MEALEGIKNIKIFDNIMFHLDDCYKEYQRYMGLLDGLSLKELGTFLQILRKNELVNNQETENEPSLLMEMTAQIDKTNSVQMMADLVNSGRDITLDDVKKIHQRLLRGTSDDIEKNYKYRDFPVTVSRIENGESVLEYLPPDSEEIIPYMEYLLDYLNDDTGLQMETVFIKPMIAHAYISILQPFGNGNTRIARLIQYGKIFDLTNKYFGKNYPHPIMYLSKNYLITRGNYRGNISNIAKMHNDESWNKWFNYNLNRIDDQLYYLINNLNNYYERNK